MPIYRARCGPSWRNGIELTAQITLTNGLYLDRGGQFHLLSLSFPSRPVILSEAKDLPPTTDLSASPL